MNKKPTVFAQAISKTATLLAGVGFVIYALSDHNGTPNSGNATIEKCGRYFRYYDRHFMLNHIYDGCVSRSGSFLGFTVSATTPEQEEDVIYENYTVCWGPGPTLEKVISTGRAIHRKDVEYKQYTFGNYSGDDFCESYHFNVPRIISRRPDLVSLR